MAAATAAGPMWGLILATMFRTYGTPEIRKPHPENTSPSAWVREPFPTGSARCISWPTNVCTLLAPVVDLAVPVIEEGLATAFSERHD